MLKIPYGKDLVVDFPLITAGGTEFAAAAPASVAAGDATVAHTRLASANISGKTVTFTSGGTYEIKPGDTITGATSAATAVVMGVRLTSGTFAAGTAAGELFVRSDTGTFQAENLDVGANLNVATIDAALDAAGLFAFIAAKRFAAGVPGTQLEGARGLINIIDATATELWEDTQIPFETYDHPLAADPQGCLFRGTATAVAAGTLTAEDLDDGYVRHLSAEAGAAVGQLLYIESATTGAGQAIAIASYVHSTRDYTLLHNFGVTPTGTVVYKIYNALARSPAHIVASNDVDFTATQKTYVPTTTAKTVIDLFAAVLDQSTGQLDAGSFAAGAIAAAGIASDAFTLAKFATDLKARLLASASVTRVDAREAAAVDGAVATDAGNAATGFEVDTSVGADVRVGVLRLTSGALAGEARLVSWTGTTIAVLSHSGMPTALKQFSATPADAVTFEFRPL